MEDGILAAQQAFEKSLRRFLDKKPRDLTHYENLREHIHAHPELSDREAETAALVSKQLRTMQRYSIEEKIGGHGLAAVCNNGSGPTVMLRADMDALPLYEQTDIPFGSKVRQKDRDGVEQPVMHACGHDMHTVALLAAAELFASNLSSWRGTLILIFQPAEEKGSGSNAMVRDGLYDRIPIPDVVLGQHVSTKRAGQVEIRCGEILSASDSFAITFHGRGGHGSAPELTIDPIIMASSTVLRLQTILSREVSSSYEFAVVTVGSVHAGFSENVIPDKAEIKINIRTRHSETREKVLAAVNRIVKAECEASGAEKDATVELISQYPLTINDHATTEKLKTTFGALFGDGFDPNVQPNSASEDFSNLGTAVGRPYAFWFWGGTDPDEFDALKAAAKQIPGNHSPFFKVATQPTLTIGVDAIAAAAMTFLDKGKDW